MLEGLSYPDTAGCEPGLGVETNLEGRLRGAFSGGEIQRLRRLRHEAHTPSVLVVVSDSFAAALPQTYVAWPQLLPAGPDTSEEP